MILLVRLLKKPIEIITYREWIHNFEGLITARHSFSIIATCRPWTLCRYDLNVMNIRNKLTLELNSSEVMRSKPI